MAFFSSVGIPALILASERITIQTPTDVTSVLCGLGIYHYYRKGHWCMVGYFVSPRLIQSRLKGKAKGKQERLGIFYTSNISNAMVKMLNRTLPLVTLKIRVPSHSPGFLG